MRINIELDDRNVKVALNRLIRAGQDMSPAMLAVSEHLKDAALESFGHQSALNGTPWAQLKASTRRQRRRGGFGEAGPILQRRGDLLRSIVSDHGPTFASAGANLIYATTQHFGAKKGEFGGVRTSLPGRSFFQPIPWSDIPARPFLGVSDYDERKIGEIVLDHAARAWR